jgi:hypothetical protein
MASALDSTLPLDSQLAPASQDELVAAVREAVAGRTPIYTIGGGTSLDYGLSAKASGVGIATTGIHRVVDYPARDMTITPRWPPSANGCRSMCPRPSAPRWAASSPPPGPARAASARGRSATT